MAKNKSDKLLKKFNNLYDRVMNGEITPMEFVESATTIKNKLKAGNVDVTEIEIILSRYEAIVTEEKAEKESVEENKQSTFSAEENAEAVEEPVAEAAEDVQPVINEPKELSPKELIARFNEAYEKQNESFKRRQELSEQASVAFSIYQKASDDEKADARKRYEELARERDAVIEEDEANKAEYNRLLKLVREERDRIAQASKANQEIVNNSQTPEPEESVPETIEEVQEPAPESEDIDAIIAAAKERYYKRSSIYANLDKVDANTENKAYQNMMSALAEYEELCKKYGVPFEEYDASVADIAEVSEKVPEEVEKPVPETVEEPVPETVEEPAVEVTEKVQDPVPEQPEEYILDEEGQKRDAALERAKKLSFELKQVRADIQYAKRNLKEATGIEKEAAEKFLAESIQNAEKISEAIRQVMSEINSIYVSENEIQKEKPAAEVAEEVSSAENGQEVRDESQNDDSTYENLRIAFVEAFNAELECVKKKDDIIKLIKAKEEEISKAAPEEKESLQIELERLLEERNEAITNLTKARNHKDDVAEQITDYLEKAFENVDVDTGSVFTEFDDIGNVAFNEVVGFAMTNILYDQYETAKEELDSATLENRDEAEKKLGLIKAARDVIIKKRKEYSAAKRPESVDIDSTSKEPVEDRASDQQAASEVNPPVSEEIVQAPTFEELRTMYIELSEKLLSLEKEKEILSKKIEKASPEQKEELYLELARSEKAHQDVYNEITNLEHEISQRLDAINDETVDQIDSLITEPDSFGAADFNERIANYFAMRYLNQKYELKDKLQNATPEERDELEIKIKALDELFDTYNSKSVKQLRLRDAFRERFFETGVVLENSENNLDSSKEPEEQPAQEIVAEEQPAQEIVAEEQIGQETSDYQVSDLSGNSEWVAVGQEFDDLAKSLAIIQGAEAIRTGQSVDEALNNGAKNVTEEVRERRKRHAQRRQEAREKDYVEILSRKINDIYSNVRELLSNFTKSFKDGGKARTGINAVIGEIVVAPKNIGENVVAGLKTTRNAAIDVKNEITEGIKSKKRNIVGFVKDIRTVLKSDAQSLEGGTVQLTGKKQDLALAIGKSLRKIRDGFKKTKDGAKTIATFPFGLAVSGISAGIDYVKKVPGEINKKYTGAKRNHLEKLKDKYAKKEMLLRAQKEKYERKLAILKGDNSNANTDPKNNPDEEVSI